MSDPSRRAVLVLVTILSGAAGCGSATVVEEEEVAGARASLAPAGYYDTVDATSASALRTTLHAVIDDHQRYPYTSTATDTWNILEAAQEDPSDANRILDLYRNASYQKYGAGNTEYNREHAWPSSFGFPNDGVSNYPYTDCHQLFLSDAGYNSSRSNKPFRYCTSACTEKPTVLNDGLGGGSGLYPGYSNWTSGSTSTGTWETWIGRRGDVARAIFYLDVRYEGGTHGVTGAAEPDLIVTDNQSQISVTTSNVSVAYMGMKSELLEWNAQDPPDDFERRRNDVVYAYQGNRNPFVDHPEWVDCLHLGVCGGGPVGCDGDGVCEAGEDCGNCASDCQSGGGAQCGNGVCEPGNGEDCISCAADCRGVQDGKTSRRYCCGDGGGQSPVSCSDSRCTSSGWACTNTPAAPYCCGNGVVEGPEGDGRCDGNP